MDLPAWQLDPTTNRASCERCGGTWSVLPTDPLPIRHRCAPRARSRRRSSGGIGDLLAAFLKAFGITPSRFGRLLAFFRRVEEPVDCGCEERREQLNQLGQRVNRWWRGAWWRGGR
jgi:hypothetical protein